MSSEPISPTRLPPALRVSAAERLVTAPDRQAAARRLVAHANAHGIDLSLLWGTVAEGPQGPFVRQVCLGVPSAGRTGMLFLSAPAHDRRLGTPEVQQSELTASLRLAVAELPNASRTLLTLGQALIEPDHAWAETSCRAAGMIWVGRLQFMRLAWPVRFAPEPAHWPAGVTVSPLRNPTDFTPDGDGSALARALDGTYEQTMDCPELCGLRATRDVIASHMATGVFDPKRWWLLRRDGAPEGCCLLNHCPNNHAIELVYLGLSPRVRGQGLGRRLLEHALRRVGEAPAREVTCAVDTRNLPAIKLYHAMGFRAFTSRIGFVSPIAVRDLEGKPLVERVGVESGGTFGTPGGQENVASANRL